MVVKRPTVSDNYWRTSLQVIDIVTNICNTFQGLRRRSAVHSEVPVAATIAGASAAKVEPTALDNLKDFHTAGVHVVPLPRSRSSVENPMT